MKTDTVIKIHTDEGIRSAIVVAIMKKYTHLIWVDDGRPGVKIHKIPHNEVRATTLDYSLAKAKKAFRRMGKTFGITKGAKVALRG